MEIGKFCYVHTIVYGGQGGKGGEAFDRYWEAKVVEKEGDICKVKYTSGESIETKELGNPITTANGSEAPEIFTEDDYFNGTFDIINEVYEFAEDFRQEWLAARYQRGAVPDPVGANIYYIYGATEGGFDWYWEAKKDGEVSITRGNQNDAIHKFTYTGYNTTVYVLDSSAQISITQDNQPRMIFSRDDYFNGTFDIESARYNFTDDFKQIWQAEQADWLNSENSNKHTEFYEPGIYYIHDEIGGFDCYKKATQTRREGDMIEFTSTDNSKKIYVRNDKFTDMIMNSTTKSLVRQIFSEDEYFGGGAFNIEDASYKFTTDFITAYNTAQEEYEVSVFLSALGNTSVGNVKLRF